jgi:hypothetical protein
MALTSPRARFDGKRAVAPEAIPVDRTLGRIPGIAAFRIHYLFSRQSPGPPWHRPTAPRFLADAPACQMKARTRKELATQPTGGLWSGGFGLEDD